MSLKPVQVYPRKSTCAGMQTCRLYQIRCFMLPVNRFYFLKLVRLSAQLSADPTVWAFSKMFHLLSRQTARHNFYLHLVKHPLKLVDVISGHFFIQVRSLIFTVFPLGVSVIGDAPFQHLIQCLDSVIQLYSWQLYIHYSFLTNLLF